MRQTTMLDELRKIEFAKRAAERFAGNPNLTTYTDGAITTGCLFALRFGMGDDCVLVFRLDEDFEPTNYTQLIKPAVAG